MIEISLIELYKTYHKETGLYRVLEKKGCKHTLFSFYNVPKKKFKNKIEIIVQELGCLFILSFHFHKFRNKKNICLGGHYAFLFFTKVFPFFLSKDYHLFIYNFYLHKLGRYTLIKTILRWLLSSKSVTLIVQSPNEINYYSNLVKNKPIFVPYCADFSPLVNDTFSQKKKYLFTGGYTNRDYKTFVQCVKELPFIDFVAVISDITSDIDNTQIPENLTLLKELHKDEFHNLLAHSAGVIIPLKDDVGSSGQMLSVAALFYNKNVAYTNFSTINYYFSSFNIGFPFESNNVESMKKTIIQLWSDSKNESSFNQIYLNNFTTEKRNNELYRIITSSNHKIYYGV
ncbi:MAG: hypothetical protein ACOYOT_05815 [Bacteroidales bacterium]